MAKRFKEPDHILCKVTSCSGKTFARNLCSAHLRRLYKNGHVNPRVPIKKRIPGSSLAKSVEFRTWTGLRYRCNNPNSSSYKNYGARGIKVCKRWDNFENFLEDMGKRPSPELSIERINNNRGYSKSNCKWGTKSEQRRNQRPKSEFK